MATKVHQAAVQTGSVPHSLFRGSMSDMEICQQLTITSLELLQQNTCSGFSRWGISPFAMDEADRASDLFIRQLCDKAACATSKEEVDTALQELRDTIQDSMDRARER